MKNLLIILCSLVSFGLYAQTYTVPAPTRCECLSFVDACTGNPLYLAGEVITQTCSYPDGNTTRNYIIGGTGVLCVPFDCGEEGQSSICMDSDTYGICYIENCTAYIMQTIPSNSEGPTINDVMLGSGNPYLDSGHGTFSNCGNAHQGALNTASSSRDILACPGDDFELYVPNMDLSGTGLCLTVTITEHPSGTLLGTDVFGQNDVSGEYVNLSALFANAVADQTYRIEMILQCCNEQKTCTKNTRKYAFVTLEGAFAYSLTGTSSNIGSFGGGTHVPFTPATSPHGTLVPYDIITLTGYNVQNTQNVDITATLYETGCNGISGDDAIEGTQIIPGTNPFQIGPFQINDSNPNECSCYRLELNYDDDCGPNPDGSTTDTYYFKIGDYCPDFTGDNPDQLQIQIGNSMNPQNVKVRQNPIDTEFILDWKPMDTVDFFDVNIFDAAGQLMETHRVASNQGSTTIPFDVASGIYFYSINMNGKSFSGKVIKQ